VGFVEVRGADALVGALVGTAGGVVPATLEAVSAAAEGPDAVPVVGVAQPAAARTHPVANAINAALTATSQDGARRAPGTLLV
jgi:hypothetical protein